MEAMLRIMRELHPDVDFEKEESLIDGGILDSFDIVTIVAEVDAHWDVQIGAEDLIPENFNSAGAIHALVQRLVKD